MKINKVIIAAKAKPEDGHALSLDGIDILNVCSCSMEAKVGTLTKVTISFYADVNEQLIKNPPDEALKKEDT